MKQVVIVDDNRLVAEGIQAGLDWARHGTQVAAVFYDGFGLLEYAQSHPVDLVITDINMPGMSGLEMAEQLLQKLPYTKIILISAYDDFAYARKAVSLGAFDYVEKPLRYEALSDIVARAVARIREEERNREILCHSRPALVENFFTDLLNTPPEDGRYFLADSAEYLEIPTGYGCYQCAVVQVVDDVALRRKIGVERLHLLMLDLKREITEALEGLPYSLVLERRWLFTIVAAGDGPAEAFQQEVNARLEGLLARMEEKRVTVVAGVGRVQRQLWDLKLSYDGAGQALRYRFYLPQASLFDIRDFSQKDTTALPHSNLKEETLVRLLLQKDTVGLKSYFELLHGELEKNMPEQVSVMLFFYELTGKLLHFLHDLDIQADALLGEIKSFSGTLAGYGSALELCQRLLELCLQICRLLEQSTESYHAQLNKQVNEYIRENYSVGELGLAAIAAAVNVSPAHLSALYKKMNGITLTDAISRERMKVAEQLLLTGGLNIREISEKVGFANQYYFSACFKKHTGQTPSRYRENGNANAPPLPQGEKA